MLHRSSQPKRRSLRALLPAALALLLPLSPAQPPPQARASTAAATAATTATAYETRLADAHRFAAEKSWALARAAYAEAAKLAPDSDTKRHCDLSAVDAAWRAMPKNAWGDWSDSSAGSRWRAEIDSMFDALLLDYEKNNRTKDSFWAAVMKNRAEYHRIAGWSESTQLEDLETLADYFASLPPNDTNAAAFFESLRDVAARASQFSYGGNDKREKLIQRFTQAGNHTGLSMENRAWCVLQRAVISTDFDKVDVAEQRARWLAAVEAARGTRWLPVAQARLFVFDILQARAGGDVAEDTPANLQPLMEKIAELRGALADAPAQPETSETDVLLESFLKWWRHPLLHLDAPDYVAAGAPLRFNYTTANCGEIMAELYRLPDDAKIRSYAYELRRNRVIPTIDHYWGWDTGGALVKRILLPGSPHESTAWVNKSAEIADGLTPGFYALGLTSTDNVSKVPEMCVVNVIVSDFRAFAVFEWDGAKRLLVYRQDSGEPACGVEISGTHSGKAWSAKTDENGFATLPAEFVWRLVPGKPPETEKFLPVDFLAFADGHPLWISADMFYPPARFYEHAQLPVPQSEVYADIFFDRPLYRPGETVHWKVIVREWRGGRFVPCEKKLALSFAHEKTEVALADELPLALNKNGTAHGSLALPGSLRPGRVYPKLFVDDSDAGNAKDGDVPRHRDVYLPQKFSVENYVPSAIHTWAWQHNPRAGARPGTDLVFVVRAEYFSGGPVTNTPVRAEFDIRWDREENFPGEQADKIDGWIKSRKNEQLEFVTDAKGEAHVRLPLPSFLCDDVRIRMNAHVLLDGAAPVKARASTTVGEKETLRVDSIKAGNGMARPGESVVFNAQVTGNFGGGGRAFSGEARVMEMKWDRHWYLTDGTRISERERETMLKRLGWDALSQLISRKQRETEWAFTEVARVPVSCGDDGRLAVPFTPKRDGLYTVQLFADGDDKPLRNYDNAPALVVADDATTDLAFSPKEGRVMGLEEWRAGEPLRMLVIMPEGVRRAVLTLYAEDEIVTRLVRSSGRVAWVSLDRAPAVLDGVQWILWNEYMGTASGDHVSIKPSNDNRITVEVVPGAATSRPGEAANVKIVTRDSQGRAVPSELAISVSDQAVSALAGGDARDKIMDVGPSSWHKVLTAQVGATLSLNRYAGPKLLRDFRPGALLNPSEKPMSHDGLRVSRVRDFLLDEDTGYTAMNTTAGSTISANLRRNFFGTAYWAPEITTDANGEAVVSFKYPDNLTQWNIRAVAVGEDGNSFGDGVAFTKTTLPFQARLQTPRFLIEGDEVTLTGLLVNRTDNDLIVTANVTSEGALDLPPKERTVTTPKQGESRATWQAKAKEPGEAAVTLAAQGGTGIPACANPHNLQKNTTQAGMPVLPSTLPLADAMRTTIPVHEDGIRQDLAASARLAPDARECSLTLALPEKLDRSRARVSLQLSPNQAAAMLDALPFLIDYPYGCVEQTMSRFLPAVLVKKTLADFGLDARALEKRIMRDTAGSAEFPLGTTARGAAQTAKRNLGAPRNTALDDVIAQSLARLAGAEIEDGHFGWWPGAKRGDPWMTAYVGWGLHLAKNAGVSVSDAMLERVTSAMVGQAADADDAKTSARNNDIAAWTLSILAQTNWQDAADSKESEKKLRATFARVYAARDGLSASGRACLLIAALRFATPDETAVLLRNLENGAWRVRDGDNASMGDTVHWGAGSGYFRAEEGAVESTALSLLALLQSDASRASQATPLQEAHPLVEPAVNWLMLNRRGTAWQNTRATAFAILALNQYLVKRTTAFPEAKIEVAINGKTWRALTLDKVAGASCSLPREQDAPTTPTTLNLDMSLLRDGKNTITLRRTGGASPVYVTALASVWASGDTVKPAGHLVATSRDFIRQKIERAPDGAMRIAPVTLGANATANNTADAGELITARVKLTVPNALNYVMVTVPKPAGCEPVNALSGWDAFLSRADGKSAKDKTNDTDADDDIDGGADDDNATATTSRRIYREEHDDHSAFFLDQVEPGEWEIRFTMRAVTPGNFRALPAKIEAMYVPEVRANSDARRLVISPSN